MWGAWIRIDAEGRILVNSPRMEMGQGVFTTVRNLVAEELACDPSLVQVRHAPLDLAFGDLDTQDSDSMRDTAHQMRVLAATARTQLLRSAAERWGMEVHSLSLSNGRVLGPRDLTAGFGELVEAASRLSLPAPEQIQLMEPARMSGREAPGLLAESITRGEPLYTGDVNLPGMLHGAIEIPDELGATVESVDSSEAMAIPGVRKVVDLGDAVSIVADRKWTAERGRRALKVRWRAPTKPALDTHSMWTQFRDTVSRPGPVFHSKGADPQAPVAGGTVLTEEFGVGMQSHAAMEPTVCVADSNGRRCEVWAPTQSPWVTYRVAAENGLDPLPGLHERISRKLSGSAGPRVTIYPMPIGGGFGRRLEQDFVRHAVLTSRAVGAPVKMIWNAAGDIHSDQFRPASYHRIEVQTAADGRIRHWLHRIAGFGIMDHGVEFPYDCEGSRIEISTLPTGIPSGSWRSTSHTQNAFARESLMDELARSVGRDPVEYRLSLLSDQPRARAVLERVATNSGWGSRDLGSEAALGAAMHSSKGSHVAIVVTVSRDSSRRCHLSRIHCVVDCGPVLDPLRARAQIEGAVAFGLTGAMDTGVSIENGRVQQRSLDEMGILRINDMPDLEIEFLVGSESLGGLGEVAVPPVAPALANALFALSGTRSRHLPLLRELPA
jgi:isoquinoline 1-oxidoreductase beta subunit